MAVDDDRMALALQDQGLYVLGLYPGSSKPLSVRSTYPLSGVTDVEWRASCFLRVSRVRNPGGR